MVGVEAKAKSLNSITSESHVSELACLIHPLVRLCVQRAVAERDSNEICYCIVRERQQQLYGCVAHFPDADPAHQILSARESREWRRPMGRPRSSWLQQVDQHLKEMGMGQGICLWDGQTEALGVPAQSGCSDALLRCMLPYQT